jgi:hypothetical protein
MHGMLIFLSSIPIILGLIDTLHWSLLLIAFICHVSSVWLLYLCGFSRFRFVAWPCTMVVIFYVGWMVLCMTDASLHEDSRLFISGARHLSRSDGSYLPLICLCTCYYMRLTHLFCIEQMWHAQLVVHTVYWCLQWFF